MKRVVPVAVGLAAGMAVGFFLGAMVTRHDEPMIVIHNATDEMLRRVSIQTDFHPTFIRRIPTGETYSIRELHPDETIIDRMSWRGPMMLTVSAAIADGKELPSQKVHVAPRGVVLAWVSSDGLTLQYSPQRTINDKWITAHRDQ